jgi:hypothetical protein
MVCGRKEVNMDKRCIKAAVVLLGALVGASMLDCKSASALQNGWIQSSPSGYSTCFDAAINDSGTRAGSCLTRNQEESFVQLGNASAPTQLAALPSTANGVPCGITALSNASAGAEIIMGWCNDASAVSQGVFWKSSTPTTAPTLLQPLSPLGLAPDVQTQAVAVSAEGMMVGVSISSSGTKTPVTWSSAGVATQLEAPVGSVNTNCEPVDISDAAPPPPPYYIGEKTTAIVGNCKDAGAGGGNKIVLWQSTSAGYTVLAPPSGAKSCVAIAVNLVATVLGQCNYPGDVTHPEVFTARGYSVTLSAVGAPTSKIFAVDINDSGDVACNYLNASGVKQPCLWTSPLLGTYALPIALPTPNGGIAVAIGNNGKVIGNYDVSGSGHWLPFSTPSYSLTSVSGGSPDGRYTDEQTSVSKMSRGGAFEAGTWIDLVMTAVDIVKAVP